MKPVQNPIICALDTQDLNQAKQLCKTIAPYVGMVKLGLEFFTKHGPEGIKQIESLGVPIFLDLKFHDIPNTVAKAVSSATHLNVSILTIHTSGGSAMMRAAKEASLEVCNTLKKTPPLIVGVTILTSLDHDDLNAIGYKHHISDQVSKLAKLAHQAGLDGVVCSPHEIEQVKQTCGTDFKTVVPGIRPQGSDNQDQKRILTPKEALQKGADFLVIGRPITQSNDPAQSVQSIVASL